uniref:Uncharacterized protein n=1 Tax=Rhizophora mucronata TaxID=61149 RepID=A0A2P2PA02_RHIMU
MVTPLFIISQQALNASLNLPSLQKPYRSAL